MRASHIALLLPLGWGSVSITFAQNPPDAGSLRQQIEQQRTLPLPPPPPAAQGAPAATALQPTTGLNVTATSFRLVGNSLLSAEQLAPALSSYLNRPLGFAELQRAADAVAAAYREAGWIVRAFLPEQDVSTGVVTLQIVEARFAGVRFEGQAAQRVSRADIEAYFKAKQTEGQPLNAKALDRALLIADDLPGVSVAGTLAPGQDGGQTALVLQTTDEALVFGDVGLDNTGARATGSNRLTANLSSNSPTGRGELLSLNLLHTQGSDYARAALTAPVGYNGLRLGVSASALAYTVIEGPSANTAAQVSGRSGSWGLDLSFPLVRERMRNLYLSAGFENKNFLSRDTQVRSDYQSNALRVGLSGNLFDDWGGGGANSGSLQMLWGQLGQMQAHTLKDTIDRSYQKISYSVSRQQTLFADHSLFLGLQGQHATQSLDSSEKFYIGGAQSVRAYPVSELGGDQGQSLSAEWRWRLDSAWLLSAFADRGQVLMLPALASEVRTRQSLRGRGLSMTWQAPMGLLIKLTWSHRDGHNPKPTANGTDGDGTLQLNRVWLTTSMPF